MAKFKFKKIIILNNEELEWLREQYETAPLSCKEIAEIFNKTFNHNYHYDSLRQEIRDNYGIKKKHFKMQEYNKWQEAVARGRYKDNGRKTPVGTIVVVKKTCGYKYTFIKLADSSYKGSAKRCGIFQLYQDYLYEQHYNVKLNDNERIIFVDGNWDNFEINNLIKVPKEIYVKMAHAGVLYKSKECKAIFIDNLQTEQLIKEYKDSLKIKNIINGNRERFIEMYNSKDYRISDIVKEFGLDCDDRYISKIARAEFGLLAKPMFKRIKDEKDYYKYKKRNLPREAKNPVQYISLYFDREQFFKVCNELHINYNNYKYFKKSDIIKDNLEQFITYMEERNLHGLDKKPDSLYGQQI